MQLSMIAMECSCVPVRHKLAEVWRRLAAQWKEHGEKKEKPKITGNPNTERKTYLGCGSG
jgi:hypothetical protein